MFVILDARRLCRITGKRMDAHNYLPLLEMGKRPECTKCNITGKNVQEKSHQFIHTVRNDYKYVTPILRKEAMEAGDLKAFEDLQKVLKRLKKGLSDDEKERMYVYMLPSVLCKSPFEKKSIINDIVTKLRRDFLL